MKYIKILKNRLLHLFLAVIILSQFWSQVFGVEYDLTVMGKLVSADGLGQLSIGLVGVLKDDLSINVIATDKHMLLEGVGDEIKQILLQPNKQPGRVCILQDILWFNGKGHIIPPSKIKIAYSMLESSLIPLQWARILNKDFDLVVVPDPCLVKVYQDSGVEIPIFVLPFGVNGIDDLLNSKKTAHPHEPFVFGTTVGNEDKKNLALLIEAFTEEFGDNEGVVLKINSRWNAPSGVCLSQKISKALADQGVFFTSKVLTRSQYIAFLYSFDCFVNISKGEGFSITPREALAIQLPCILTNNTAQKTICATGFVRSVPSEIKESADYNGIFGTEPTGYFLNCSKSDVRQALRDVYENYTFYLEKAKPGREWVVQYRWENLHKKYLNLIKPNKIMLGEENKVTDDYFMTDSPVLFQRYVDTFP